MTVQSLLTEVLPKSKTRRSLHPGAAENRIFLQFSTRCGSQTRAPGLEQHGLASAATEIRRSRRGRTPSADFHGGGAKYYVAYQRLAHRCGRGGVF